ncbi:unnamed protein product, partial [Amoebophrya sp. A120]|eukprot:GSA120T00017158001.1
MLLGKSAKNTGNNGWKKSLKHFTQAEGENLVKVIQTNVIDLSKAVNGGWTLLDNLPNKKLTKE